MIPFHRIAAVAVAAQAAFAVPTLAAIGPSPSIELRIDGQAFPIATASLDGKTFSIVAAGQGAVIETAGAVVVLNGVIDPDPSVNYDMVITDFVGPSTFELVFITPIVPTSVPYDCLSSLVGTLTDTAGTDGVYLTPVAGNPAQVATIGLSNANMGVDLGGSVTDPASGAPGTTVVYGPYSAGPVAGPGPGPWTTMSVITSFTLSGNGDIAALTGSAYVVPVPSPALAAPGILFLLCIHRPRRMAR